MRNRFHEPRSDTPSPRRLDDVNVNKSLYGNKRETPSIRCPESAPPPPGGSGPRTPRIRASRGRRAATDAGSTAGQPGPRAEPWTVRDTGRALTVRDASGVLARPRHEARGRRRQGGRYPGPGSRRPRQARGQPGAQKSFRFRHPSPEPNTGGKRLTWYG